MTLKKYLNWGWGIALVYTLFVIGILGFLFFSTTQSVDLVTEEYYDQQIKYQKQIDRINRTTDLPVTLRWNFLAENKTIEFQFPDSLIPDKFSGNILIFRPSDSRLDKRIAITADQKGKQILDAKFLQKGLWRLKIFWNYGDTEYYNEGIVVIE